MTAEVIVANGTGIAMAADSAVTIGNKKIYNSALKLFALSKIQPVGIMIFGNAVLGDIPWEIIIKTYRAQLRDTSFENLESYGIDFLEYIAKTDSFQNQKMQEQWIGSNVTSYYKLIRDNFLKETEPIIKKNGKITQEEVTIIIQEVVKRHHSNIITNKLIDGMDVAFEKQLRNKYTSLFRERKKAIFQEISGAINKSSVSKLYDIAVWLHTREIFPSNTSGIVIAGYGTNEIFPQIKTYRIEGIFDGKIKFKVLLEKGFTPKDGNSCIIIPFAQEEMVKTFMNGLHPIIGDMVGNYLNQISGRLPDLLNEEDLKGCVLDKDAFRLKFTTKSGELLQDFMANLQQLIATSQVNPIMSMVAALPKDELAAMAESLVNLTAFKRKVSNAMETVGGPIDVLVISKGDGLVWIKRKHYFPRELNNNFFENYFKGVHDGKET